MIRQHLACPSVRRGAAALALLCALLPFVPALAGTAGDCPPLGSMPGYQAGSAPDRRDYQSASFTVQEGGNTSDVTVAGALCKQSYTPVDGHEPNSDLEIQANYRAQMAQLGAKVVFQDDRNTVATLDKDGTRTWLKVYSQETEIDTTVLTVVPLKITLTAPSGNDYRLLGHMPGYEAGDPSRRNFDKEDFDVKDGDDSRTVSVEGARYDVDYTSPGDKDPQSDAAIQGNYRHALQQLGAQILFSDDRNTDARLQKDGKTIWVKVYSQETEIDVHTIEEKPLALSIQPPKADALKAALDKGGHVALYVNFDFDKATLRPDAAPVIAQVAALLKANPDLKLSVEGHTDNVGGHDYNVTLSKARAASVVAALVKAGIANGRVEAAGHGPDQPVASNDTAEGRARNRRVELVKR